MTRYAFEEGTGRLLDARFEDCGWPAEPDLQWRRYYSSRKTARCPNGHLLVAKQRRKPDGSVTRYWSHLFGEISNLPPAADHPCEPVNEFASWCTPCPSRVHTSRPVELPSSQPAAPQADANWRWMKHHAKVLARKHAATVRIISDACAFLTAQRRGGNSIGPREIALVSSQDQRQLLVRHGLPGNRVQVADRTAAAGGRECLAPSRRTRRARP